MLVVIGIVLLGVAVGVAVLVSLRGKRRREALWRDLAARFGLEVRPDSGDGVSGSYGGVAITIDSLTRSNKGAFLRLRAQNPDEPAGPEVQRRKLAGNRGAIDGTGDPDFDRVFVVTGAPGALSADQRSLLVAASADSESLAGIPILGDDGFVVLLDWTATRDPEAVSAWVDRMLRTGTELVG